MPHRAGVGWRGFCFGLSGAPAVRGRVSRVLTFFCILSFTVIFLVFLAVIIFLPPLYYLPVILGALIIGIPVIVLTAPVAHENKPLTGAERARLSRLAKLTVVVLTALIMTGWYLAPWNAAPAGAALGLLTVALSSLAALYQKRKRA